MAGTGLLEKLFALGDQSCNPLCSPIWRWRFSMFDNPLCSKSYIGSVQREGTLAQRPLKISWPCSHGEVPGNTGLRKQQDNSSQRQICLEKCNFLLISYNYILGGYVSAPEWVHHQTFMRPELEWKVVHHNRHHINLFQADSSILNLSKAAQWADPKIIFRCSKARHEGSGWPSWRHFFTLIWENQVR